ncbi:MAG: hypothetical protein QGG89_07100 [Vicinamibacterales bacterium]|nr:hypothetical protein [Vicinamibacterales bacterium]
MDHIRPAGPDRRRQPFSWVAAAAVVLVAGTACLVAAQSQDASPEARAISFLSAEVPRWPTKNNCFSCHNNGDAARALYTAVGMGYEVEAEALRDTTAWLQEPEAWDDNALGLEFADKKLARIQFAGALGDAMVAGAISDPTPLADAAVEPRPETAAVYDALVDQYAAREQQILQTA